MRIPPETAHFRLFPPRLRLFAEILFFLLRILPRHFCVPFFERKEDPDIRNGVDLLYGYLNGIALEIIGFGAAIRAKRTQGPTCPKPAPAMIPMALQLFAHPCAALAFHADCAIKPAPGEPLLQLQEMGLHHAAQPRHDCGRF
jgi:hypothetical protein